MRSRNNFLILNLFTNLIYLRETETKGSKDEEIRRDNIKDE